MISGEANTGYNSTSRRKPKTPVFHHIIEAREISLSSSASANTLLRDEEILKNRGLQLFSSVSAIFIGHNEDLLTEILLRLPPKSLLRFQCVSKQWLSIISSSNFRRLHCRKFGSSCSSSDAASLFFFRRIVNRASELNFISFCGQDVKPMGTLTSRLSNFLPGEILGLHSCNGLFCIDFNLNYDHREFVVYNPTTGHYRLIPKCKFAEERYECPVSINITYDPLKSDHYKLVCLWEDQDEDLAHLLVYSSETGIWRDTEEVIEVPDEYTSNGRLYSGYYFEHGVLWNGNLHWVINWKVLCFDLDNECINWSVPSLPMPRNCYRYFGESAGSLCAIQANHYQAKLFDVFELERDYSKWFLKFSIDLNPLTVLYPSMLATQYFPQFLFPCFLLSEKEMKAKIVISLVSKIILFNINDLTIKKLVDIEPVQPYYSWRDMYDWYQTFTFTETLGCV